MTTTVLTGYYASYTLTAPTSVLSIAPSGYLSRQTSTIAGLFGSISSPSNVTILNDGTISGDVGIVLQTSAVVINGSPSDHAALIGGFEFADEGILMTAPGGADQVVNYATIAGGVTLDMGGSVVNGSASDTSAVIFGRGVAGGVSPGTRLYGVDFGFDSAVSYLGHVTNYGTITYGIHVKESCDLANGAPTDTSAQITGYTAFQALAGTVTNYGVMIGLGTLPGGAGGLGVYFQSDGSVINLGTIEGSVGGVRMAFGDGLSNGSAYLTSALIEGGYGLNTKSVNVDNSGTIKGTVSFGASVSAGPLVNAASAAVIGQVDGVHLASSATLDNYGTVKGVTGAAVVVASADCLVKAEPGSVFVGAVAGGGGAFELTGGAGTITALGAATLVGSVAATISNFGTYSIDSGAAWTLAGTGALTASQILLDAGSLTCAGTLTSAGVGVDISGSGMLTNAAGGLITGTIAVSADVGGAGAFVNAGGVNGTGGVSVSFGSKSDTLVVEAGSYFYGAAHGGGGTLELAMPYGVLSGLGGAGSITVGSYLSFSAFGTYRLDKGDTLALKGTNTLGAGQILDNFGTVTGGVTLTSSSAVIEAENGSSITAPVVGGTGGLILQGGASTVTGLGASAVFSGAVSLEGSGFGVYAIEAGASLTIKGNSTLAFPTFLSNRGTVNLAGNLNDQGPLTNLGLVAVQNGHNLAIQSVIDNPGTIAIQGTTAVTQLRVAASGLTLQGAGVVTLAAADSHIQGITSAAVLTNEDTILGAGFVGEQTMGLTNAASGVIDATGALTVRVTAGDTLVTKGLMEAAATGKLYLVNETIDQTGGGTILSTGGLVSLQGVTVRGGVLATTGSGHMNAAGTGATLDGRVIKGGGGAPVAITGLVQSTGGVPLTLMGTIANSGKINLHAGKLIIGAGGVTLSGAGQVNLSSSLANIIVGATGTTTFLNNGNRIDGAGLLGDGSMILNNQSGVILGNQALALTLDTGTNTIANSGTIENNGSGGLVVASAINNNGTLLAAGGTLTLEGSVTSTGQIQINGGTLYAKTTTFNANVTFTGATGVLELTNSQTYTGKVNEASKTGVVAFDLLDIAFVSGKTSATLMGATLNVTNGTSTAHINLSGVTAGATFTVADDGHGGTSVVDPPPPAAPALVQAMAGMAGGPTARLETSQHSFLLSGALTAPHRGVQA